MDKTMPFQRRSYGLLLALKHFSTLHYSPPTASLLYGCEESRSLMHTMPCKLDLIALESLLSLSRSLFWEAPNFYSPTWSADS
jgi:hypothetical protein